ncbi:hypothetical protein DSL92_01150 [Billgrantia gudaonensis]|uniref:Uncharacterized protein n=1 Tax=Billgrantia gudaonensis TaxID=376427 RepID=A0A3S0R5J7_9GAMM|nr:hypothetical protein DSL92_01150 [Halomonas gudaonensis]
MRDLHEDSTMIVETIIAMGHTDLRSSPRASKLGSIGAPPGGAALSCLSGLLFRQARPMTNVSGFMGPAESPGPTTQSRHPA